MPLWLPAWYRVSSPSPRPDHRVECAGDSTMKPVSSTRSTTRAMGRTCTYSTRANGDLVGTTTIAGIDPRDIEAISAGEDGNLVVADIGDNQGSNA